VNVVTALADFLRDHGVTIVLGSTLVLAVFALMIACTRSLVSKRRLAGLAMVAIVVYGAIAVVPLPRLTPRLMSDGPAAVGNTVVGETSRPMTVGPAQLVELPARAAVDRPDPAPSQLQFAATPNAPPAPSVVASALPDLATTIAWVLLVGAVVVALHLLVGWWRLRRILAASRTAPAELRRAARLPRHVRLCIANRRVQPFCCGVLRGCIVLPPNLDAVSAETIFVVRHEAAHLRAGDMRLRVFAALLRPVLFWQPLFWWLQSQLRFTGELLADDAAAEGAVGDYVRCMVALAAKPAPRVTGALAAFAFHRPSELYRRLQMMLQREGSLSTFTSPWRRLIHGVSATAIVAGSAMFFGVERVAAQDPVRAERTEELTSEVETLRVMVRELRAELRLLRRAHDRRSATEALREGQPAPKDGTGYTIQRGDTLESIAITFYGSPARADRLRALNPDVDPRRLRIGQVLRIGGDLYTYEPVADERVEDEPVADARAFEAPVATTSPRSLDAIADVITRCIELQGQVQIAEIELLRAKEAMANGLASKFDVEIAKIQLGVKQKQHRAIRGMLQRELDHARRQLSQLEKLHERGFVPEHEVAEVSSFIQVLMGVF